MERDPKQLSLPIPFKEERSESIDRIGVRPALPSLVGANVITALPSLVGANVITEKEDEIVTVMSQMVWTVVLSEGEVCHADSE